ncbi:MAG TPA: hypothetical protein VD997_17050 [Phycisphaerales bacterium]|nr:hypothetical protein [Phycisphaerales bacterium]
MEPATDLFPDGLGYKTRVWVIPEGRKEYNKIVADSYVSDLFENQAERGFQNYKGWLRSEGPYVWAYGTDGETIRICGYFMDEATRKNFVVCGAWKGKAGRGNSRPHHAEAIVKRAIDTRSEGVSIPEEARRGTAHPESKDREEEGVLRDQPPA